MPPEINLNPVLNKYSQFAEANMKNEKAACTLKISGKDGTFEVAAAKESCYGKKAAGQGLITNKEVRSVFFESIRQQFGGSSLLPVKVAKALFGNDYDDKKTKEVDYVS